MSKNIKATLNGLYFFAMSQGSYSDYGVDGFYVCDHKVTEEEWLEFCRKESDYRSVKKSELITFEQRNFREEGYEEYIVQWRKWHDWINQRGSYESLFAKEHNMTPVEYEELHLDF